MFNTQFLHECLWIVFIQVKSVDEFVTEHNREKAYCTELLYFKPSVKREKIFSMANFYKKKDSEIL